MATVTLDSSVLSKAVSLVHAAVGAKSVTVKNGKELSCTVEKVTIRQAAAIIRTVARVGGRPDLLGGADAVHVCAVDEQLAIFSAIGAGAPVDGPVLASMNQRLEACSFLGGDRLSAADLGLFVATHAAVAAIASSGPGGAFDAHVHLVRWFDHMQHLPAVAPLLASLQLSSVKITVSNALFAAPLGEAPSAPAAKQAGKKDSKKNAKAGKAEAKPAAAKAAAGAGKEDKAAAKKAKKNAKAAKAPKPAAAGVPLIGRLDVRVGLITAAEPHPTEPDKLMVEQIDVGTGVIQVVSGICSFAKPADVIGRKACIIVNLKAGEVKGVTSAGRMFVATSKDGATKEILFVDDAKVGESLSWAGVEAKPDAPVSSKNFSKLLKELSTNDARQPQYRDLPFTTSAGIVTVPTVAGGTVA